MNYPKLDSRDYVTNQNSSKPETLPTQLWVVYYLGMRGNWIFGLPHFYYENAIKYANSLERPTRILEYTLTKNNEYKQEPVQKIIKKIRKCIP